MKPAKSTQIMLGYRTIAVTTVDIAEQMLKFIESVIRDELARNRREVFFERQRRMGKTLKDVGLRAKN